MKLPLSTLIMVQGIVTAGLLVWGQYWAGVYDIYHNQGDPIWHISLILTVIYLAVLSSLLAIALSFFIGGKERNHRVLKAVLSLSGLSFTLIIGVALISIITIFPKAMMGWSTWRPIWLEYLPAFWTSLAVFLLIPVAFMCWWFVGSNMLSTLTSDYKIGNSKKNEERIAPTRGKNMSDDDRLNFEKATNAYKATLELWKLASQQIYSRFAVMLTANSIILSIIGLSFTDRFTILGDVRKWLIGSGLVLCIIWVVFMIAGWRVECHYRNKYAEFEKDAIPFGQKIAIEIHDWRSCLFFLGTILTIMVFLVTLSILFVKSC